MFSLLPRFHCLLFAPFFLASTCLVQGQEAFKSPASLTTAVNQTLEKVGPFLAKEPDETGSQYASKVVNALENAIKDAKDPNLSAPRLQPARYYLNGELKDGRRPNGASQPVVVQGRLDAPTAIYYLTTDPKNKKVPTAQLAAARQNVPNGKDVPILLINVGKMGKGPPQYYLQK